MTYTEPSPKKSMAAENGLLSKYSPTDKSLLSTYIKSGIKRGVQLIFDATFSNEDEEYRDTKALEELIS